MDVLVLYEKLIWRIRFIEIKAIRAFHTQLTKTDKNLN